MLKDVIDVQLGERKTRIRYLSSLADLEQYCTDVDLLLLDRALLNCGIEVSPDLIVPGGERVKSPFVFSEIIDTFFSHNLHRQSMVAVLGGGALCDAAAYAASVFMRGMRYTLIPSTLLAMVDASIGGKTAINSHSCKNMIGVFSVPEEVLICPGLLRSIGRRQFVNGIAEVLKAGMLLDPSILTLLETQLQQDADIHASCMRTDSSAVLHELIDRAIRVKLKVVEQDFFEKDQRRFLNLGHSFAHAAESSAQQRNYDMLHGEAVGLGIRSSLVLGMRLGITDESYAIRIFSLLDALGYPRDYAGLGMRQMLTAFKFDKKNDAQGVNLVLQRRQGDTLLRRVAISSIQDVFESMNADQEKEA